PEPLHRHPPNECPDAGIRGDQERIPGGLRELGAGIRPAVASDVTLRGDQPRSRGAQDEGTTATGLPRGGCWCSRTRNGRIVPPGRSYGMIGGEKPKREPPRT